MLINVPQYIDVEDKIVGPLTAKQLGWLALMGVVLLVLWNTIPKVGFFVIGIPIGLLFVALAFYKPYGQTLSSFLMHGMFYYFKPKIYVWKRTEQVVAAPKKVEPIKVVKNPEKKLTPEQLREMAALLDSGGTQRDENIVNFMKDRKNKFPR